MERRKHGKDKYSGLEMHAEEMREDCAAAVKQIDDRMYTADLEDRCDEIFCYGISFYKKRCMIMKK